MLGNELRFPQRTGFLVDFEAVLARNPPLR
jgi:hypothetical protein